MGRRSYLVIEKAELICHFLSPSTAHGWIPRLKVVNSAWTWKQASLPS